MRSASPPPEHPSRTIYVACFVAPLAAAAIIILTNSNFSRHSESAVRETPIGSDFLQEWVGGHIIASGRTEQIYDGVLAQRLQHDPELLGFRWSESAYYPMVYPPFYYWLVSPLSNLRIDVAATIWCLLNALAFSIALTLLAIDVGPQMPRYAGLIAGGTLFYPLLMSLSMGQKSGFLLLIGVATYRLARRNKMFWSGIVFGCIVFKPHLAVVIGLALLLKGQFRFAIGAMIPVGLAAGASAWMGLNVCADYLAFCLGAGTYSSHAGYAFVDAHNIWAAAKFAFDSWAPTLGVIVAWAAALSAIGLLWKTMRGPIDVAGDRFGLQFSALVVGTVLLSPHFLTYDLSILLLPMVVVAGSCACRQLSHVPNNGHVEFGRAPWQWASLCTVFAAGGLFRPMAEMTGVPCSVILLGSWLALLAWDASARFEETEATAESQGLATAGSRARASAQRLPSDPLTSQSHPGFAVEK